jgi:hypothetical protein
MRIGLGAFFYTGSVESRFFGPSAAAILVGWASGRARVAIELQIDSSGSSESLATHRQDKTDGEI